MAVAEKDAIEARIVLAQARDMNDLGGHHLGNVVAWPQRTRVDPFGLYFALAEPFERALVRLFHRYALDRVERMAGRDEERIDRMLHLDRDHRIGLVVGETSLHFAIGSRLPEHEVARLHILDRLQPIAGVDPRLRREALVYRD